MVIVLDDHDISAILRLNVRKGGVDDNVRIMIKAKRLRIVDGKMRG